MRNDSQGVHAPEDASLPEIVEVENGLHSYPLRGGRCELMIGHLNKDDGRSAQREKTEMQQTPPFPASAASSSSSPVISPGLVSPSEFALVIFDRR
jgi:hypothetical protein